MKRRPHSRPAKPKLIRLHEPKIGEEHGLISSLVNVLAQAREGGIVGYALVILQEDADGLAVHKDSAIHEDHHRYVVLGAIREMEHRFMADYRPEEEA